MIDIHHHCLPGVDDGPREWDEAVAMCRAAAGEGIETILATPHVMRGLWQPVALSKLRTLLEDLQSRVGDHPRLLSGSEYFFGHDVADLLEAGDAILPLAGSRYVLVELVANNIPPLIEQPLYRMQLGGWVPVLAHPERNIVFQSHPEALESLVHLGARTQITAGSLTGDFGDAAQKAAEEFLRRRLVHFVATDAHNMGKRAPLMARAKAALGELVDAGTVDALLQQNPLAVVENRPLPWEPEPLSVARDGLFTRLRSFFTT